MTLLTPARRAVWFLVAVLASAACASKVDSDVESVEGDSVGKTVNAGAPASATGFTPPASSTPRLSQAEWLAKTLPQAGTPEVYLSGCSPELIDPSYQVVPMVGCGIHQDPSAGVEYGQCDVMPFCVGPRDCTAEAGGRCEGQPAPAFCSYGAVEPEVCTSDADCSLQGPGTCAGELAHYRCDPTGTCLPPGRYCSYATQPCAVDADCNAAPNGQCIHPIVNTHCVYNACLTDADCSAGSRCGCGTCVAASCAADSDCSSGQRCALWFGCPDYPQGYDCTTPADECAPEDYGCWFKDGSYQSIRIFCE